MILALLHRAGADFLASYSVGDIGKLYQEETFDISQLAFMLKAAQNDADCILQASQHSRLRHVRPSCPVALFARPLATSSVQ